MRVASLLLATVLLAACAAPRDPVPDADPAALAQALARAPVVLLGEVHDNAAQHALRLQALARLLQGGARPVFAFEQFDREQQAPLDAARAAGGSVAERAGRMIEAAGGRGWKWDFYRPYVELALQYDLPVIAANLSRGQAMRVGQEGVAAVFDEGERRALRLDAVDPAVLKAQVQEVERGHCGRMPAEALEPVARAQIARDAVLAASIAPYAGRGVVLITGNGHARRDIGVVRHLAPEIAAHTVTIGLLERESAPEESAQERAGAFDVAFFTVAQARKDPCAGVGPMKSMAPAAAAAAPAPNSP